MKDSRILELKLENYFQNYRQSIVLLGARQVGKTTLLRRIFPEALYLLVDEKNIKDTLEAYDSSVYKTLIGDKKQILLDELHLLENPGRAVKIIYDQLPDVQIIVTGSSSLHIKNKTSESMAGRSIDYYLYPLTIGEFLHQQGIEENNHIFITDKILNQDDSKTVKLYSYKEFLNEIMLHGLYPGVINIRQKEEKEEYLINIAEKAIFKDILELQLIDSREKAMELLRLLAYQIGNLVNYTEISSRIGISAETVRRYIDIFEDSYILYKVYPFSKSKRDEIGKSPKIYFWDLGVRNALINNFDSLRIRSDFGAMFENLVFSEVKKEINYLKLRYDVNFWRTKSGSEVDLVLSSRQEIIGCEVKYGQGKFSKAFRQRYPEAKSHVLSLDNIL